MKCDDCFNLLEEYIDGEAIERDAVQVSAHLITCAACAHEFEVWAAGWPDCLPRRVTHSPGLRQL